MYCKKKTIVGAIRRSADPVNAYVKATAHNATTQYDILVLVLLGADISHGKRKGMGSALHWLVPVAVAASRSLGADCVSS